MSGYRADLASLSRAYAEALDRRDADGLRAIFRDDAELETVWAEPGRDSARLRGIEEIVTIPRVLERWPSTLHLVGQGSFGSSERASVTGTVPCVAHHFEHTDRGVVDFVMEITYRDRYVDDGRAWRIASRQVVIDHRYRRPLTPQDPIEP